MAKYTIEETTLVSIADALRTQEGSVTPIPVSEYASRILNLQLLGSTNLDALALIDKAVTDGNLDGLSWTEIETIADALADGTIVKRDGMRLLGFYKSFTYGNATCYAFIIGILQDYLDTTPRGFTFWCIGSNTPFLTGIFADDKNLHIIRTQFGSADSNADGWGGTGRSDILRTALQSGGTIYNNMPSDMTAVMKPKTTYYGPTWNSTTTDVSSVTDIMFLLSEKEVFNINNSSEWEFKNSNPFTPFWQYEGTGPAHNEQYQLFTKEGITYNSHGKLRSRGSLWTRTCSPHYTHSFCLVDALGGWNSDHASYTYQAAPCFCV